MTSSASTQSPGRSRRRIQDRILMKTCDGFVEKSFSSKENEPFPGNRTEPAWKKKENERRALRNKQQCDAWLFLCQKMPANRPSNCRWNESSNSNCIRNISSTRWSSCPYTVTAPAVATATMLAAVLHAAAMLLQRKVCSKGHSSCACSNNACNSSSIANISSDCSSSSHSISYNSYQSSQSSSPAAASVWCSQN